MRRQYVTLWQDNEKLQTELTQREREIAGQRLAVERYRAECIARSSNPAAAEKRIDRLMKRIAARFAAAQRESAKQHDALTAELAHLNEQAEQLRQAQDEVNQRDHDLAQRESACETQRLELAATQLSRARELRQLQLRRKHDERQLATLRDEVERIARLLLDDNVETMARAA